VPIIGTSPTFIDVAEDRERFQKLLDKLGSAAAAQPHRATSQQALRWPPENRLPAGGAPELRAGRPRHGDRLRRRRSAALHDAKP
jgi:hypothetical protein